MISLTKTQQDHYRAVDWLLSEGPFGTGKTTLMAIVFIQKAHRNIGFWTPVFDHDARTQKSKLYGAISKVLNSESSFSNYELLYSNIRSEIKMQCKSGNGNPYLTGEE